MFYLADLLFERHDLLVFLILNDQHRDRAGPEFIHQDILSLNGLYTVRQVSQDVIIDPRVKISPHRGDQKDHGQDQDQMPGFDYRTSKTLHKYCLSFTIDKTRSTRWHGRLL